MNKLTVCLLATGIIVLCSRAEEISNLPRDKLVKYMKTISGLKTISGVDFDHLGADRNKGVEVIQEKTGKLPGLLVTEIPAFSDGATRLQSFVDEIISNWKNGYFMFIIWGSRPNPLSQMEVFNATGDAVEDERKWTDLITEGGELNKEWKKQLDALVPYFQQLESAGVVVFCSLLPDINKEGYLWRGRPGLNGSLRLYQLTHDYLTKHHLINSIFWTWHLYSLTDVEQYWPGNNYVDMVSITMEGCACDEYSEPEYQKLLSVVGDTPISMDYNSKVPTPQYLALQPRWAWFVLALPDLLSFSNADNLNSTFHSSMIINNGDIEFFKP